MPSSIQARLRLRPSRWASLPSPRSLTFAIGSQSAPPSSGSDGKKCESHTANAPGTRTRRIRSASASTGEDDLRDLFQNGLATLAANLIAPIIDGGRRAAEVERQEAVERQRLAEYGQAVLVALEEVETALARERRLRERLDSLERQVRLAEETTRRLRDEYLGGVTSYIEVLISLTSAQGLQRELLRARRELIEYRIALYRALAGGFETPLEAQAKAEGGEPPPEDTAP